MNITQDNTDFEDTEYTQIKEQQTEDNTGHKMRIEVPDGETIEEESPVEMDESRESSNNTKSIWDNLSLLSITNGRSRARLKDIPKLYKGFGDKDKIIKKPSKRLSFLANLKRCINIRGTTLYLLDMVQEKLCKVPINKESYIFIEEHYDGLPASLFEALWVEGEDNPPVSMYDDEQWLRIVRGEYKGLTVGKLEDGYVVSIGRFKA